MRTFVDIPEPVYREMKMCADIEGKTVNEIILDCVAVRFRSPRAPAKQESQPRFPSIRSKHPGSLKLGKNGAYEDKELDVELPRKVNRLTQPILKSYAPGSIRLNNEPIDHLEEPEKMKESSPEPRKRFEVPVIRSSRPGTLELTNEQIDELTAFS